MRASITEHEMDLYSKARGSMPDSHQIILIETGSKTAFEENAP
jgi:hypothetical protein